MSNHCSDPVTCPSGNCPGCKNGALNCQDTRCAPFCQDCTTNMSQHDLAANMMLLSILLCLILIFFIIWFIYGPRLFEDHDDHDRANVLVPDAYKKVSTQ